MERHVWDKLGGLPNRSVMGVAPMDYLAGDLPKTKIVNKKIRIILANLDTNRFPNAYGDDFLLCL